ncbi:GNAT family N-acetyltransferase [Streptomyces sp. NPDC048172]|uniref:GNAT family N-acetyltransferase n=1 Tax=Streptomyces sp. NPDC048172 TaxID=3365505 RepID=UPI003710BF2D
MTHTNSCPTVRPRTAHDLDGCVRALAAVHARDGYPVNWPEHPAAWLDQPSLLGAWVAELDGRLVGHVTLARPAAGDAAPALVGAGVDFRDVAVLGRLFVDPAARGHGIGALLMARVADEARERGLRTVLEVVAKDTAAVALYERLGWEFLDTVEQRWGPGGRAVSVRCYATP